MACEPSVMAAEAAFLAALGSADRVVRDGDELVVSGAGTPLRFRPQPPVEDRALTGTRWGLGAVGRRGGVVRSRRGGAVAGARRFGDRISADLLALDVARDDIGCADDLGRQDGHVLAVLDAGPRYEISGDRLTLTAPDGRALVYRAG